MGYIRHHAIVVTSSNIPLIERARVHAANLGMTVTDLVGSQVNGYASFLIAPDGSKEGWPESGDSDNARAKWIDWAKSQRWDDDSSSLEWAELRFGSDDFYDGVKAAKVTNHEWKDRKR